MRLLVLILVVGILISLGSAAVSLVRDSSGESRRTVRALTWRIGLSVALFAVLMILVFTGLLEPRGGPMAPPG